MARKYSNPYTTFVKNVLMPLRVPRDIDEQSPVDFLANVSRNICPTVSYAFNTWRTFWNRTSNDSPLAKQILDECDEYKSDFKKYIEKKPEDHKIVVCESLSTASHPVTLNNLADELWIDLKEVLKSYLITDCSGAPGPYNKALKSECLDVNTAKSDMLLKLENSFQGNPRHIFLFNELDQAKRNPEKIPFFTEDALDPRGISQCDIIQYLTFFESVYRIVQNGILTIRDIDDCFSDRFFTFIHNPRIQETELYIQPATYINIFELYKLWKEYHVKNMSSPGEIEMFLNHEIPDCYLENRTYEKGSWNIRKRASFEKSFYNVNLTKKTNSAGSKHFQMRRLFPSQLENILKLQTEIQEALPDCNLFVASDKDEILESMLIDFCYGLFDGDQLAAICIIVLNREDEKRNFIQKFGPVVAQTQNKELGFIDCLTFDSIQVRQEYRGYGIQAFFLRVADNLAASLGASCVMASVAPENKYSLDRFIDAGYKVVTTQKMQGHYEGKERNIVFKSIG